MQITPQTRGAIVGLADAHALPIALVGGKGKRLGELARRGFRVPGGFVLTTDEHRAHMPENRVSAELRSRLRSAYERLGRDEAVAVRSSATVEDGETTAQAGLFATVLEVRGIDALVRAVETCWRSTARYGDGHAGADVAMAVVVQRMVQATAAGVCFTANPISGARDEVVVSAVRGLGERLVSGQADADEWIVGPNGAENLAAPENAIGEAQVHELARFAGEVEAAFGGPQDVEWAYEGDVLYLLQTRPITTLTETMGSALASEPIPKGHWVREATHWPEPVSPAYDSIVQPRFNRAVRQMAERYGTLIEGLDRRSIRGWVYERMVPIGGREVPPPPVWVQRVLARAWPLIWPLRKRLKRGIAAARSDLVFSRIEQWQRSERPETEARARELAARPLESLSDEMLETHLTDTVRFLEACADIHFSLSPSHSVTVAELAFFVRDELGWDETRFVDLLVGCSTRSTEPSDALSALAECVRRSPPLAEALRHGGADPVSSTREVDPSFSHALEGYLDWYGLRAMRLEVSEPTLRERPEMVVGWILDEATSPPREANEPSRHRALEEARTALEARDPSTRSRFERILSRAEAGYAVREDNEFFTINLPLGLLRFALLEVGRRLADRGTLRRPDDIFFLREDEIRGALAKPTPHFDEVALRRADHAWALEHPGPARYGRDPGMPPIEWLPEEVRKFTAAVLWSYEHIFAHDASTRADLASLEHTADGCLELRGLAVSPGTVRASARVVRDEREFSSIRPGEVVICRITSPPWSVIFGRIGGLVTESGGTLSHAAIIAREHHVPAVTAVKGALEQIRTGDTVVVDGKCGTVNVDVRERRTK